MNKYILIFLVVAGFVISYKQLETKKEELRIDHKNEKGIRKGETPKCNTSLSRVYNNCDAIYRIYKEEYTTIITPDGKPNIIADQVCNKGLIVTEQNKITYEEKCDEIIYPKIRQAVFGIACYQVSNGIKMMYKSEYCRIYKEADEYIQGGLK